MIAFSMTFLFFAYQATNGDEKALLKMGFLTMAVLGTGWGYALKKYEQETDHQYSPVMRI